MRFSKRFLLGLCLSGLLVTAFHPHSNSVVARRPFLLSSVSSPPSSSLRMLDPQSMMDLTNSASSMFQSGIAASDLLLSFADQGQNLAGIFFQASLLPYLLYLYWLSFRANRMPALSNFGFQFLLLFVISTIPSGIISRSVYGFSLADTDYLHGGAELLLTVTNILIVLGFKEAMTKPEQAPIGKPRGIALAIAAGFAALCAIGPSILPGHAPFLFGLGNFPAEQVAQFPWVTYAEPENALSIPTWAIHFSSVYEFLFAMGLVWQFAETTGNERWKGLTWGMLPLHASGICACTYHFFYNPSSLQFLVTAQAGLTLLGNITVMLAAFRIAQSNGWTPQELIPTFNKNMSPLGLVADGLAMKPLAIQEENAQSTTDLALNLAAATLVTSYVVKYGELGLDVPFTANPFVAIAMVTAIPGVTAYYFYNKSKSAGEWDPMAALPKFSMPGQSSESGGPSLSMADVKKYGVAGTVAYVITELAFWLVAFPVAAVALYKSTGHWPDVINDTNDRAAVLAFIFAGANIARAFVPVRLGAALALAPWVDDNLLNRGKANEGTEAVVVDVEAKPIATPPPKSPQVIPPPVWAVKKLTESAVTETAAVNVEAKPMPIPPPKPSQVIPPPVPEAQQLVESVVEARESSQEERNAALTSTANTAASTNIFSSMLSMFPSYNKVPRVTTLAPQKGVTPKKLSAPPAKQVLESVAEDKVEVAQGKKESIQIVGGPTDREVPAPQKPSLKANSVVPFFMDVDES